MGNIDKKTEVAEVEPKKRKQMAKHKVNPFLGQTVEICIGTAKVRTGISSPLIDTNGVVTHATEITRIQRVDKESFIKIYTRNVKHFFDLNLTSYQTLQIIFKVYQERICTDKIYLNWVEIESKIKDEEIDFSRAAFYRGLTGLEEKGFIAKSNLTHQYFVNPTIFFNGDRVKFIDEYEKI